MINPRILQEIIDEQCKLDIPIEIVKLIIDIKFIVDIIQEKYPRLKYCDQAIDGVYQYSPSCSFMCSKYLVLRAYIYQIYISNCQTSTLGDYGLYVKITTTHDSLFSIDLTNLKEYTNGKSIQITDNSDNIIDLPSYMMNEEKGLMENFEIGPPVNEIRLHGDFDLGQQFSEICVIPCIIYGTIIGNIKGDICSCCDKVYKKILNKILYI